MKRSIRGIVTHAYSYAGDYAVKLLITDDEGTTSSCSELITVAVPILTMRFNPN